MVFLEPPPIKLHLFRIDRGQIFLSEKPLVIAAELNVIVTVVYRVFQDVVADDVRGIGVGNVVEVDHDQVSGVVLVVVVEERVLLFSHPPENTLKRAVHFLATLADFVFGAFLMFSRVSFPLDSFVLRLLKEFLLEPEMD